MSNAVKHLAGIEKIHLSAQREGDGYVVNGSLPWVSNVGADHLVIVAASVEGEGYIMFAAEGGLPGLEQHPCPARSDEHTSELQSLMRISYAVFCLKTKRQTNLPLSLYRYPITTTHNN